MTARAMPEPTRRAHSHDNRQTLDELKTAYSELREAVDALRGQQEDLEKVVAQQHEVLAQYSRVVESLPVAVVTTDEQGLVESANPAATELLGANGAGPTSQSLLAFLDGEGEPGVELTRLLQEHGSLHRRTSLKAPAGGTLPVDVYAARDHGSAGQSVTWVLTPVRSDADGDELPKALVALTRLAAVVESVEDLLPRAAQICQAALGDMVSVSLMIGSPTEPEVVASTSTLAQAVDGAQVMADEGPCASSFELKATVVSRNLLQDERWPRLRRHLDGINATGVVASPVVDDDVVIGALNAFTTADAGPDDQQVRACELLAASVGSLIHELRRRSELHTAAEGMRQALTSRSVIDQAKGIVMADKRCTADEAFQHLVDLSSRSHVKLRDLAAAIVARTSGGHAPLP